MNNRVIPVSLAIIDKDERKRLEQMIAGNPMVRLVEEDAEEMGVLIYEPSDSVDEDLPHIIHALESGQAEDVYLTGNAADPDVLIRAMRNGIREFLQFPVQENDFRAAIMRTAMRQSLFEDGAEKGDIITVLGCKPGMGTTSLAVSLACVINETRPGRVLLLDLRRPAGEVPYFLDLKYEYNWGHLMDDISRLDPTYLQSVVAAHESGLHILPAPVGTTRPDPQSMHLILEQLRGVYEYVIVDTSYPDDENLPKEIESADIILVAMQLSLPCLARGVRVVESIRSQDPDAERRMKLVVNRATKNSSIGLSEAAEVLERPITWSIPEDGDAAMSAINQGTPLVLAYPKSPAAKAIRAIATELAPPPEKESKGFSLPFASLFSRKKKETEETDKTAGVES